MGANGNFSMKYELLQLIIQEKVGSKREVGGKKLSWMSNKTLAGTKLSACHGNSSNKRSICQPSLNMAQEEEEVGLFTYVLANTPQYYQIM